jgi:catechol 2,3-dioxygenase-like lactoylglutathione lyase family enzyme
MLIRAATVFTVRDLAASIAHYRDVLGFAVAFEYGAPAFYAGVYRDDVAIHLRSGARWIPGNGAIAIFVDDVDALHSELIAAGAKLLKPPQDYPYGMRDFDVADPDGNELTFGMQVASATTSN